MAGNERHAAVDALLAAITGEPLPEDLRDDPAALAEHRRAATDVALLREQLTLLGDALAAPAPEAPRAPDGPAAPAEPVRPAGPTAPAEPAASAVTGASAEPGVSGASGGPVPPTEPTGPAEPAGPRRRSAARPPAGKPRGAGRPAGPSGRRGRRGARLLLGAGAASAAAVLLGGLAWLGVQGGTSQGGGAGSSAAQADSGTSGAKLSQEGLIACARLVVEGTVVRVEPVPQERRDRITLRVTRYYKPSSGPEEVVFPVDRDAGPRLEEGDRTLVTVPVDGAEPVDRAVGRDLASRRDSVLRALPGSRGLTCDGGPGPTE